MYRSELKYVIDYNTALIIKNRINKFLEYDKNSDENGFYNVRSLYFDDYKNTALNDNLSSQKIRKKYRIRIYNQQGDLIRLEKKIKHDQVGYKKSCLITREQYDSILKNDYMSIMSEANDELLEEFLHYATMVHLKPKVIVVYDRQSFIYPYGTVRITFDHQVKHVMNTVDLFSDHQIGCPTVEEDQIVLEVKYSGYLPIHIKQMIQQSVTPRQSVSKYALSRMRSY
ncbi:MAG: polyphosphate polymerase domain-containing protein [Clostridia bacterium]|nr:polyphosphate polymerase domain-containing protein [Clostridia bacterium]